MTIVGSVRRAVRGHGGAGARDGRDAGDRVAERARRTFYPEVQALRALAIGMVLLYHLFPWNRWAQGAFVGVDVFFVISGFLISGHLIAEVDRTGRVNLADFYARRARRLLPASLSVLLVIVATAPFFIPREGWGDSGRSVLASAFYVMNLWATHDVASQAQSLVYLLPSVHYWSLSAEEQFYLLWPPMILLAVGCAAALRRRGRHTGPVVAIGIALSVVAVASFVCSVVWTVRHQQTAFFVTPTRAWEFAAGGLVALVLRRWAPAPWTATVLRWVGLALVLPGSLVMTLPDILPGSSVLAAGDLFPGPFAALAVVGTALVIIAGGTTQGSPLDRVVAWRPIQWLGLVSYSVYLWHWPIITYAEARSGASVSGLTRVVVFVLTLLLGHLWQRYVEDASRYVPGLKQDTRATLWLGLAGMLLVGGAGALLAAISG